MLAAPLSAVPGSNALVDGGSCGCPARCRARSCMSPRARSPRLDSTASKIDIAMNAIASQDVVLARNVAAPRPPKKVCAAPAPNAPAKPPPRPACSRTTRIKATQINTWIVTKNANTVDLQEARPPEGRHGETVRPYHPPWTPSSQAQRLRAARVSRTRAAANGAISARGNRRRQTASTCRDNAQERRRLEACTADQRAVDVGLRQERGGILRFDAAAVLNAHGRRDRV